jgi:hypothetical protein
MFDPKKSLIWCACTAAVLLVACSPSPDGRDTDAKAGGTASSVTSKPVDNTAPVEFDQAQLTIIVREDGLLVETPGRGQPLQFGETTPEQASDALGALGPPVRSSNSECPAGPLDFMEWRNGLQLAFQNGQLAGWWASDKARGIATANGLRPGSPRARVGAAPIENTSIGKLFTADGVNGLLDDRSGSSVTALWAGAACIFS